MAIVHDNGTAFVDPQLPNMLGILVSIFLISGKVFGSGVLPPILSHTFPQGECPGGVFTGSVDFHLSPTEAECVTQTINGQPVNGIIANTCNTSPATVIYSDPVGSLFDSYNFGNNTNISVEVWFSLTESIVEEVFESTLIEISTITPFLSANENITVSLYPNDTQFLYGFGRIAIDESNVYDSPSYSIAALNNQGGFCERSDGNTIFTSSKTDGFDAVMASVRSSPNVMYKWMFSLGGNGNGIGQFYVGTSNDAVVENAIPFPALLLYGAYPRRLKINPDSTIRLGCSIKTEYLHLPIVYHKFAIYDRAVTDSEVDTIFNS